MSFVYSRFVDKFRFVVLSLIEATTILLQNLTTTQLDAFGPEQTSALSVEQKSGLSAVQLDALANAGSILYSTVAPIVTVN